MKNRHIMASNKNNANAIIFLAVSMLLFLMAGSAFAATTVESNTVLEDKPQTTPDNAFYFLDTLFDKLSLILSFDDKQKAEKAIEIANERLIEAKQMADKGKLAEMETARREHADALIEAENAIQRIGQRQDEKSLLDSAKDLSEIQREAINHSAKLSLLESVSSKREAEPELKDKARELVNEMESKSSEFEHALESRKIEIKSKLKNLGNRGELEIQIEVKKIENEAGLPAAMQNRARLEISIAKSSLDELKLKLDEKQKQNSKFAGLNLKVQRAEKLLDDAELRVFDDDFNRINELIGMADDFGRIMLQNINDLNLVLRTRVEVKGNVSIQDSTKSKLDELKNSISAEEKLVDLRIRLEFKDGQLKSRERETANLSQSQKDLWESIKKDAIDAIKMAANGQKLEIRVDSELEFEHQRELEIENEIRNEVEIEFEHAQEREIEIEIGDNRGGNGNEIEIGDDRGRNGNEAEPGDDREDNEAEPGDNHGGTGNAELGDDRGGGSSGGGSGSGSGGNGSDDD